MNVISTTKGNLHFCSKHIQCNVVNCIYLMESPYLPRSFFGNPYSCRLLRGIRSSLKRNHGYYRFTSTWRTRLVKLNRARASERASSREKFNKGNLTHPYTTMHVVTLPVSKNIRVSVTILSSRLSL